MIVYLTRGLNLSVENNLLQGLNNKQQEAVKSVAGPLLIMAGAGSGKTRVLTHRVAYIIEQNLANPWNILAITFTNKAAREMRERVDKLMGEGAEDIWVSTFHALCVRILRRNAERIGYERAFNIASTSEQRTLVKRLLAALNVDSKQYTPRTILGTISNAKNNMVTPEEFASNAKGPYEEVVAKVYRQYQEELHRNQAMDFDDLIMKTIELFKEFPDVLEYYQNKFHYIHVDEYQDTNEAQYELVTLLAARYRNICVVGDADQSIYGWRGANMENILNFEKDYPDATVVKLEQNYRSTKNILKAANAVIDNNINRKDKTLWTDNAAGDKVHYYRAGNENDEAYYVIKQVQKLRQDQDYDYSDFAVLYRTNAQSRVIEEALLKAGIPYKLVGAHKFYDRMEIQDVLAYLRLATNPDDSLSFRRVVNVPKRGIGTTSVDKLADFATMNNITMLEAARQAGAANIRGKAQGQLLAFADLIADLHDFQMEHNITELTDEILQRSGYKEMLETEKTLENQSRLENLEEFKSVTAEFEKNWMPTDEESNMFVDFLSDLALVSDQDDVEEDAPEVTLMTLHAAKGLEFPVVFLIGMEEGIFPLGRATEDDGELEEERRLAYVGITRAEKELYLTNAQSRMLYGRRQINPASRFITEIDTDVLVSEGHKASEIARPAGRRDYPFDRYRKKTSFQPGQRIENKGTGAEKKAWKIGDQVKHKAWGTGTIIKVTGQGEGMELDIAFPSQGIKRLLASFAPITRV
ncbi:DNA helicase PcrA [Ligilactobacillus saerimneri]|uniref:DNA helicase PcrA n=1 Tax=Ligilactobacillus saerimneri TaxID=228229 RepID=UPI0006864B67|nr:DNA helicase PcrA [Ligilactobacillus saerimneri]MBU5310012.1 DNA helicase PcrA [Ligilactobacillus saerimneri]MDY4003523.1 DNA helicase PcrA [Ligilactobacillus saerimneri]